MASSSPTISSTWFYMQRNLCFLFVCRVGAVNRYFIKFCLVKVGIVFVGQPQAALRYHHNNYHGHKEQTRPPLKTHTHTHTIYTTTFLCTFLMNIKNKNITPFIVLRLTTFFVGPSFNNIIYIYEPMCRFLYSIIYLMYA